MSLNDTPTPDEVPVGAPAEADSPHGAQDDVVEHDAVSSDPINGAVPESEDVAADEAGDDPVAVLEAEVASLRDQLIRARADYDNLNKRRLREVGEARDRGAQALAHNLVDVLDSFQMALSAASQCADDQMAKGVQLVYDQLITALTNSGLEAVPGVGADFDPNYHEAVHAEEDENERDVPEVIDVLRPGWTFKGQLLRAATVRVVH